MGIFGRSKRSKRLSDLESRCMISGARVEAMDADSDADAVPYLRIIEKSGAKERYSMITRTIAARSYRNIKRDSIQNNKPLHKVVDEYLERYIDVYNGLADNDALKKSILEIDENLGINALKELIQNAARGEFGEDDITRYEGIKGALRYNLGYEPDISITLKEGALDDSLKEEDANLDTLFYYTCMSAVSNWIYEKAVVGDILEHTEGMERYISALVTIEISAARFLQSVSDKGEKDIWRKRIRSDIEGINQDIADNHGLDMHEYCKSLYADLLAKDNIEEAKELFIEYACITTQLPLLLGNSVRDIEDLRYELETKFGSQETFDYTLRSNLQ